MPFAEKAFKDLASFEPIKSIPEQEEGVGKKRGSPDCWENSWTNSTL